MITLQDHLTFSRGTKKATNIIGANPSVYKGIDKSTIIIMSDNFNDNSINVAKWTETDDASNRIREQSQRIEISNPHTDTATLFQRQLKTIKNVSSGTVAIQCNMDWNDPTTNNASGAFVLWADNNNRALIQSRGSTGNNYRLGVTQASISRYDFHTGVNRGSDVKITYDIATNDIKFWYWNVSVWSQMGSTQNWNLGSPIHAILTTSDIITYIGADVIYFDNFYLSKQDYSTQFPV